MNVKTLKEYLGWGFLLWLIGYILGFILFFIVPKPLLGWFIMPIGVVVTVWVLNRKIKGGDVNYYINMAAAWTIIAVLFDYFFIVKALKPEDGYYKLDVYVYYILTFLLPIFVGQRKIQAQKKVASPVS